MAMGKKKVQLTINNFKDLPIESHNNLEAKWSYLEKEVILILNSPVYHKSLEELYRIAEDLYAQKFSPLLLNLQTIIEDYLSEKVEVLTNQNGEEEVIIKISDFWKEFCRHVQTIKNIFLYYDRSPKCFKYNTIQSISFGLFSRIIIFNPFIKIKLITEILTYIQMDRDGKNIDKELLKSVIEMFNSLQIYQELFENEFLKASHIYYELEGTKNINIYDVPKYITYVNERILEEQQRVKCYLNKQSEKWLLNIVHKRLIEDHISEILTKGFDKLIEEKMYNELILIYKLFQRISGGTKYLLEYFKEVIVKKGIAITDLKNEKAMIQDLLDFKDDLDTIIEKSFEIRHDFHECVRSAFKNFINNFNTKAAQLLAKYIDAKLRCKDISDEDLEVVLNKVIQLFKYVQGKDIFEAFYKKHLAKRLLLGKSANQDAENSMISKLKDECGSMFTSNIEGMFQDINLSKTINSSFKQKIKNNQECLASEFSVNVLTSSYWPNYPNYNINLPCELVNYQQCFQKFYLNNHSGRKLLWQPSLGHCLVKALFNCGFKELQVSLFQAVVLLLFNTTDEIGYKEIQESINLDEAELKRTLLSLACGKTRVLIKNPKGKDIDENDAFLYNAKFTDKLFRVRINQIQLQETAEEEKETEKNVLVDRQFQIDAAIVRVMKQKKTIKHSMLVRELYNILDIPVNQSDLKKRIELLIEREYMERDKDNKSNYIYIA